ncbi:MAG: peptidyl-prolyl cis-trans isomerase, partial [Candidatus Hydrogenedentes bacterium]|nr:peptidyl-prolyl cis-trans isomerase [Candidatus Hydrogenedentota bacterium]
TLGDPSMIEAAQHDVSERDVASQFGRDFAHAVFAAPSGHWSGPIASGYGTHLVHVDSITPGGRPDFATVKPKVLERWRDDRKVEDRATYFASLLEKYDVSIDESVKPLIGPLDSPVTPPPPTEDVGR